MKTAIFIVVVLLVGIHSGVFAGNGQQAVHPKKGPAICGSAAEQVHSKFQTIHIADNPGFAASLDEISKMTGKQSSVSEEINPNRKVTPHRNPGMAVLFSGIIPGGGQYYNRQYVKGALFTTTIAGGLVAFLVSGDSYYYAPVTGNGYGYWYDSGWSTMKTIGLVVMCASYLASVVDAPLSSMWINRKNNVSIHIGPNRSLLVGLSPDISINALGYTRPFPTIGAKLSVSLR